MASRIRLAALVSISFAATACGEETASSKRLESITWHPAQHKLTWNVSEGRVDGNGKFKADQTRSYVIEMDKAIMSFNGEDRKFSEQEAANVHVLMDFISRYAAESTVWWDQGQGEKIDKNRAETEPRRLHKHPPAWKDKDSDQVKEKPVKVKTPAQATPIVHRK